MIDYETIFWKVLENSYCVNELASLDHGPGHWARVARNGRALAELVEGVDMELVNLFALFHDSMRQTEFADPDHGRRGAGLAATLGVESKLSVERWVTFYTACVLHDSGQTSADPTIGVCWDADRLDLPRVGIKVDSQFLSTNAAKEVIR